MPSTSPTQFVLDTVVAALQTETTFSIVRIWRNDQQASNKTLVYPYVSMVTYNNDAENGNSDPLCRANVEIMCSANVESDTLGSGKSQEQASLIAARVKYRLETYNVNALPANVDAYFTTNIVAMIVDGHVGNFNINDNKIQLGVACTVWYTIQ